MVRRVLLLTSLLAVAAAAALPAKQLGALSPYGRKKLGRKRRSPPHGLKLERRTKPGDPCDPNKQMGTDYAPLNGQPPLYCLDAGADGCLAFECLTAEQRNPGDSSKSHYRPSWYRAAGKDPCSKGNICRKKGFWCTCASDPNFKNPDNGAQAETIKNEMWGPTM